MQHSSSQQQIVELTKQLEEQTSKLATSGKRNDPDAKGPTSFPKKKKNMQRRAYDDSPSPAADDPFFESVRSGNTSNMNNTIDSNMAQPMRRPGK